MFTEWILEALYSYYLCISHATLNVVFLEVRWYLIFNVEKARINLCQHFIKKYKITVILWTVSSKDVRQRNQVLSEQMLPSIGWHSCFLFGTSGFKHMPLETGYRDSDISSASPVFWQEITYNLNYPKLDASTHILYNSLFAKHLYNSTLYEAIFFSV
jgi:hypothetical protein